MTTRDIELETTIETLNNAGFTFKVGRDDLGWYAEAWLDDERVCRTGGSVLVHPLEAAVSYAAAFWQAAQSEALAYGL